ncbi:MAG: hypothetical protein KC978_12225, partial [Candidatus Omnitrophica bacterium]|nr:hypothetical protein [Candidatus Omnitrophota bacterium]
QTINEGATSNYSQLESNRVFSTIPVPNVAPGQTLFVDLDLVPFAGASSFNYAQEDCSVSYSDGFGHAFELLPLDMNHQFDSQLIRLEMAGSQYVVVSNPKLFFANRSPSDPSAQKVPREMAKFSLSRDGALAYVSSEDPDKILATIHTRFNRLFSKSWLNAGYLLIVGSDVEFPSFRRKVSCTFGGEQEMWVCDDVYADVDKDDNYTPELIVGRITGKHPDTYSALFSRALTPSYFDKTLTISGTGDGDSDFWESARECNALLDQRYADSFIYRLRNFDESIRNNVYLFNSDNTDFVYYRDHGNVGSWDSFGISSVPNMSFGSKHPIIYSNACLTGHIQSENNLAEKFLAQNAAVFIGATEVSPRSGNNALGKKIASIHKVGHSIGRAMRNGKRSLAGDLHWYSLCWSRLTVSRQNLLYNIYGDPFRGSSTFFPKDSIPKTTFDPPVETLNINIPFYQVNSDDGIDFVNIPDDELGGHLDVVNEPLVPSYRVTANYEPGIRVNDIQLVSRSNQSNETGLTLPVSWWNQKTSMGPNDVPSPGTFPSDAFHWDTLETLDGGQEMMLTVHPFFYNATTKDATYYQDYSFHIDFVTSTVDIEAVTPTYRSVPLGESQEIDVRLTNTGSAEVRVNVSLDIQDMGSFEVASSQSQNGIVIPAGGSLIRHFSWDPAGSPETFYQIIARVFDSSHLGELDKGYENFRVGIPNLSIKSMSFGSVTPGFIGIGEVADLGMEIEGIGDIPVDGTLTLEIRNVGDGDRVSSWQHKFYELIPGATLTYHTDWDSGGILAGSYQVKGWVDHDGGTTPVETVEFETKRDMQWDWDDLEDVYRHGEKIVGTANLRHPNGSVVEPADTAGISVLRPNLETFVPALNLNTMDPYYSTQFIVTALEPSGIHTLTSTASKTGYKTATNIRWFVVTENPFTMNATPEVAIADGITPVHVESEAVREGTATINDGTLITINPLVGSVATEDASPTLGGKQVAASGGRFAFDWLPPTMTALDGFAHAFLGGDRPQSGISVVFKGVDFNGNRRVDVADIGFVRSKESNEFGSDAFDTRADLNGDDLIDATDTQEVIDRWSLEFADADSCPICTPTPKDFGVKIR